MSNTRETILEAYKTSLAGILTKNGYLSNVQSVDRSPEFMKFAASISATPALNVIDTADVFVKNINATYAIANLVIKLEALIKTADDLAIKTNKLIADIKKHTDNLSITNVRKGFYGDIEINYATAQADFNVIITLNYSYERSAP